MVSREEQNPGKLKQKIPLVDGGRNRHCFSFILKNQLLFKLQNLKLVISKIAKKTIMNKFLTSHFDSESPENFPEDFQGGAPGDGIIYISSDDEMECASSASVDDLESLSDDDEVALLAQCVERQLELPSTSGCIQIPSSSNKQEVTRTATPRLAYVPGPMFDAGYFDLGMGRGPIARDSRLRNDHPINLCSQ